VYSMSIQTAGAAPKKMNGSGGASTTVYLKGSNSRIDMESALGNETTIHDAKTGKAVVLKEFSGQKLMITLTKEDWIKKNNASADIAFDLQDETKVIYGHECKKAVAKMADGRTFIVYYAPDLLVANKEYDPTFANLPGLAMEYEIESGRMQFSYRVTRISYDPVLVSKFDFPKSGYRVMTYEENMKLKK
jgi:GLPGLI family protein